MTYRSKTVIKNIKNDYRQHVIINVHHHHRHHRRNHDPTDAAVYYNANAKSSF